MRSYFVICFTCVDFLRIYNTCYGIVSLNDSGAGEVRGHVDKLTVGWNADSRLPKFVYFIKFDFYLWLPYDKFVGLFLCN